VVHKLLGIENGWKEKIFMRKNQCLASGFNQVSGSGSESGSKRAKMTQKIEKS
jgi:hypothetical protein